MPSKPEFDELLNLMTARMETVVDERFKELYRRLESIQKVVDIQVGNTDEDRKDFAQMKINQATIAQGIKEIVDMLNQMSKRVTDKVVDQTNITIESAVEKVTESVEPAINRAVNKIKNGVPLKASKPWWKLW